MVNAITGQAGPGGATSAPPSLARDEKSFAIGARARADNCLEAFAKTARGGEPALEGDVVHRQAGCLEQRLGATYSLLHDPAARGGPGRRFEPADKGPPAHAGLPGERLYRQRAVQARREPADQPVQCLVRCALRGRPLDELRLPARPHRRGHQRRATILAACAP